MNEESRKKPNALNLRASINYEASLQQRSESGVAQTCHRTPRREARHYKFIVSARSFSVGRKKYLHFSFHPGSRSTCLWRVDNAVLWCREW